MGFVSRFYIENHSFWNYNKRYWRLCSRTVHEREGFNMYLVFACLSALFAGLTSILAKCGIRKTNSDFATALRTIIVLLFAWVMVWITGAQSGLRDISTKTAVFLVLSGLATGASWLCYFRALQLGDVNKVVPVDKSSTILTILFSIVILHETDDLAVRLAGTVLIGLGTWLMIEKRGSEEKQTQGAWLLFAVLSAVFAALTSVLGKIGIENIDSDLGTALRTCVVLVMAWIVVAVKPGGRAKYATTGRELCFIALSGLATGASWLCYYRALQLGDVSIVAPIDKLSILVSIAFSAVVFHERLTKRAAVGLALIVVGTVGMVLL